MSAGADSGIATRVALPAHRPRAEGARLVVASGPDQGRFLELVPGEWIVGSAPACALALTDPLVSRQHLRVTVSEGRIRAQDLGSTNGSFAQGLRFDSVDLASGAVVVVGGTELKVVHPAAGGPPSTGLGPLVGVSARMREVFAAIERVAPTDLMVLLVGETGTGKELAAAALHERSARAAGPLVVCDLAAARPAYLEAELFGCVAGALPGVETDRAGAFAQAEGGTLLLDEIADLPLELQPRLLRALERRQFRPLGADEPREADVRVIASTNRDLAAEVEAAHFRADLYHRLAVVQIALPPLRQRAEDVPLLVEQILREASGGRPPPMVPRETLDALVAHDWPGNVRQLRNVLERALVLSAGERLLDVAVLGLDAVTPSVPHPTTHPGGRVIPFKDAKERLVDCWEREYLTALLERTDRNVSLAARRAGLARPYLYELLRKHNLAP